MEESVMGENPKAVGPGSEVVGLRELEYNMFPRRLLASLFHAPTSNQS